MEEGSPMIAKGGGSLDLPLCTPQHLKVGRRGE
jgi:hypothetical protein